MSVPSQESKRAEGAILSHSKTIVADFGIVLTLMYFFFPHFIGSFNIGFNILYSLQNLNFYQGCYI